MIPSNGEVLPVLMPFTIADAQKNLERNSMPYSVIDILKEVFHQDFGKAIQNYMDMRPGALQEAINNKDAKEFRLLWFSEPKVESSLDQPMCTTAVDLIFRTLTEAVVGDGQAMWKRFNIDFRVRYMLCLWDKMCSDPIIAPNNLVPPDYITEQKSQITNKYLLPIMYAEDYAKAGQKMLKRYYPKALEKPTAVKGLELARRMNLQVKRVRFEKGSDIQGRIYFDWTWVSMVNKHGTFVKRRVPPMTILINTDLCPTKEIENSTIIHECCHVYLDLLFFKLQMLSGKPFTSFTSKKKTKPRYSQINTPIDWMELQAEKLPAYVLMEENVTRREIERRLAENGGVRSPENIMRTIEQLANTFKVSRSMAKYRMIELGYPEAEGVFSYIDNMRVPDHGCGGVWEQGVTYSISFAEIGTLLRESVDFASILRGGRYTYLEGHFCLNSNQYIEFDSFGQRRLNAYARRHIDECCISFTVHGRYVSTVYEDGQAARKTPVKDKYQSRHGLGAEPETKARIKENRLFAQDSEIWVKLKTEMPDSLGEALNLILHEKGITQMELAMRLGVSRAAWRKWCVCRMSLRHIVAVCIALDVRADIGMELVRLTGRTFLNNREHNLLLAMIYETKDLTVARANEIMRQEKFEPLTEGIDEELAC